MSSLPLHPMIVHVPMALAILVPLVAVGLLGAWLKGWLPARAWLVAVGLQAALTTGALLALNTGERDEDRAEKVVQEAAIEAHEDAAKLFTAVAAGVLVLMLVPVFVRREGLRRGLAAGATAATLVVAGLGFHVGHKGGELVYRHGAAQAFAKDPGPQRVTPSRPSEGEDD